MKGIFLSAALLCAVFFTTGVVAENPATSQPAALTIYNGNFALVRQYIPLELTSAVSNVSFTEVSSHLEPDSVILRDPSGQRSLQVLEQNYRADPVSQELLLSLYEGKTIDFLVSPAGSPQQIVKGKIIRSGYVPSMVRYGQYQAPAYSQPIIEVDGVLRFGLPGQPLFPALTADTILKPTLNWQLRTDKPGRFDAELAYITSGMTWQADYNLIAPEKGDVMDLVGWVTITNTSGRSFENARIKLLAGDVNKVENSNELAIAGRAMKEMLAADAPAPAVTEHTFDEFHMYTLQRPATLHDQETKQVEFVRAMNVASKRLYVYDGASVNWNQYRYWQPEQIRSDRDFGTQCNKKVWVMQKFVNSAKNGLGMPLPKGKLRFYRRDTDGHLEFTGESMIDHTPKDETVRVYTGNAFDLTGERKRTDFSIDTRNNWINESFEIRVRNHKTEPVNVIIAERLYRGLSWKITDESQAHTKTDSQKMEFYVTVQPEGEQVVTYTVHYTW
ncbi:MAG TPA: DUF4139 domain-containing protein [Terriglobales bacterium]|nr:DUF4139 domain-containing protein [Terriglobales bacterium]